MVKIGLNQFLLANYKTTSYNGSEISNDMIYNNIMSQNCEPTCANAQCAEWTTVCYLTKQFRIHKRKNDVLGRILPLFVRSHMEHIAKAKLHFSVFPCLLIIESD